ncbi:cadherin-like domain-containing protein [Vibrio navarrensis]
MARCAMTFEPAADFNGEINFGYQVKDADGDVDMARTKRLRMLP